MITEAEIDLLSQDELKSKLIEAERQLEQKSFIALEVKDAMYDFLNKVELVKSHENHGALSALTPFLDKLK